MSINWTPNPTWWNIETILSQDTRPYTYKSIYLLNDSRPTFQTNSDPYATSDGQFYPQGGEHTWDATQDKPCIIDGETAYSTRYVIIYSNASLQLVPNNSGADLDSIIGCIVHGVTAIAAFGGQRAFEFIRFRPYLTSLGSAAFANCYNLQSVEIPEGLQRLESSTFVGCRNLRQIQLPSTLTYIGAQCFALCASLSTITLPTRVTTLQDGTFLSCSQLVSISMPQVTSIGTSVFTGCRSLRTVYLPNIQAIGASAFVECHSLCSFVLGNNSVTISGGNGYNSHSLRSVVFPSDVVLKENAFQTSRLNHVTFKGNCTILGIGFHNTPSLSRITLAQDFDSSINVSHATLAPEMMVNMFGQLKDNNAKTLTLGTINLAKLTPEQKAIATNKNWVLA